MTFTDSIQVCFKKYADFSGTASRSEFWWFTLFLVVTGAILHLVGIFLSLVFFLATFIPALAAGARRLHDTGRSGWLQLLWCIPLVGWIILMILLVLAGKSRGAAVAA